MSEVKPTGYVSPWAAFTDDSGAVNHTNIVAVNPYTRVVISLPGRHKRDEDIDRMVEEHNYLAQAYAQLQTDRDALQSKFDDPRGNICELCESYDSEHDCAECRWNHLDNFHACEPIFDNGGE